MLLYIIKSPEIMGINITFPVLIVLLRRVYKGSEVWDI